MTMKKLLFYFINLLFSLSSFAQNSITSDPSGTDAIQKIVGMPSSPNSALYSGGTFSTQFVSTGNSPTTRQLVGIGSLANNSLVMNIGILGQSSGIGSNYGVVGLAKGEASFENVGGYFSVETNARGLQIGIMSSVYSHYELSSNSRYAFMGETKTRTSNTAYGTYASADNLGPGSVVGGHFAALNYENSPGDRTGLYSEASGISGLNIGIKTISMGSGDTFGIVSEVFGAVNSVAGKFIANSNATNKFQLLLEEKGNDFARISFRNINGDGWHQAANKGADAASSLFNFYYVPNASDVLSLRGDGNAILAGTLTQSSDGRLKKNIQPLNNVSQKIDQIRGVYFNWKDEHHSQTKQIGFVAQEIEEVFPELVNTDSKGFKSVAYANMSAVLLEAIKEQNQRIATFERELSEIKSLLKNSLNNDSKNSK
jgi:hypothetical protein